MKMTIKTATWLLGVVLVSAATGAAQSPADADSASRDYRAPLEGFALQPPAGGEKSARRVPTILVQWTKQDPKTSRTLWTLRVYRTTFQNPRADIQDYAEAIRERLGIQVGAKIDELSYLDAAGCPAIQILGHVAEKTSTDATGLKSQIPQTFFRQAWFLRKPGEFLVLDFATVEERSEQLAATWDKLLSSVELFDPNVYLRRQEENIQRAGVLLTNLSGEAIQSALPTTPRWFLVRKDGANVGWLCMRGRPVRRNKVAGYEIDSWMMLQLPDQPVRLVCQRQFTDPSMSMELWSGRVQFGSGEQSALFVEDGLRQGGLIIATLNDGRRQTAERKEISGKMIGMYLPKAVGTLLPSLLDPSKPAGYTFAEYDRQMNDFRMRTVTVIGSEQLNGRQAVKIADQPEADAEAVTYWVDEKGQILQSLSPDGLLSVSTGEQAVLTAYPNARSVIGQMNQTSPAPQTGQKPRRGKRMR
ncbi:MAG: hypothetical protein JXA11_01135 [Phycisphaerae bacterium]|nr:hypothetical protein [Phycisphaerae bacterium]